MIVGPVKEIFQLDLNIKQSTVFGLL